MTEKRKTKRDFYKEILNYDAIAENAELVEFINHEIELLDKKNGSKKPTEQQVKNERTKEIILENLVTPMTVTEICKMLTTLGEGEFSTQRVSSLMRQLNLDEKVERVQDKRVTRFVKVEG